MSPSRGRRHFHLFYFIERILFLIFLRFSSIQRYAKELLLLVVIMANGRSSCSCANVSCDWRAASACRPRLAFVVLVSHVLRARLKSLEGLLFNIELLIYIYRFVSDNELNNRLKQPRKWRAGGAPGKGACRVLRDFDATARRTVSRLC